MQGQSKVVRIQIRYLAITSQTWNGKRVITIYISLNTEYNIECRRMAIRYIYLNISRTEDVVRACAIGPGRVRVRSMPNLASPSMIDLFRTVCFNSIPEILDGTTNTNSNIMM